jgi:hypothetical protein
MAQKTTQKTFVIADGTLEINLGVDGLSPGTTKSWVSVIGPTDASAGTYTVYATINEGEQPRKILNSVGANVGIIDATKTGPGTAIGEFEGVQFEGPAHMITIVAAGIVGQTVVTVKVKQT